MCFFGSGVEGLRKMYKETIAPLCPPTTKCVSFEENPTKNRYQVRMSQPRKVAFG